jgi:hypothetical protein
MIWLRAQAGLLFLRLTPDLLSQETLLAKQDQTFKFIHWLCILGRKPISCRETITEAMQESQCWARAISLGKLRETQEIT